MIGIEPSGKALGEQTMMTVCSVQQRTELHATDHEKGNIMGRNGGEGREWDEE